MRYNRKPIRTVKKQQKIDLREDCGKYYNSQAWKSLRNEYFNNHPLCEECLKRDIVSPGEHVHHKLPFIKGVNEQQKWDILLNINNLITLCETCHYGIHDRMKKYGLSFCDSLSDEEYNYYHGLK